MTPPVPARSRRRRPIDPGVAWRRRLTRYRPNLVEDVLASLAAVHGRPIWQPRNDPTSELVVTILSQNSADVNAERAFEMLRARYTPAPPAGDRISTGPTTHTDEDLPRSRRPGWGGRGLREAAPPDWGAVENAPLDELVDVIRPGGLAPQKAPRIQASLRSLREARGDYSLDFLADLPAADARAWLTGIDGIGPKTASVVLLFSFGMPLMPVDRHVERVSKRIGLLPPKATADQAHELFLALLEPDQMYEAHVNLITHGRRICTARDPHHDICPVAARCRFVNPRAP